METIYTYDNKKNERLVTLSSNSGLYLASDPFNYTVNAAKSALIISGMLFVMGDIQSLDNLSDDIGVTHEDAVGIVAEASEE